MCICVRMLFSMTKLHTMCVRNVINIRPVHAYYYINNRFSTMYTVLYVDL
jgi:hypothetical protein